MLARARAFVGEDSDEGDGSDRAASPESPPRRRARRVIGVGISSRLYPAQEPDDTAGPGLSGMPSPAGATASPQPHRPLSLPALSSGPPEDTPGHEQGGKVRGPRWREQAKGGKNLRLNVTRKFKALTAPVFDGPIE